MKTAPPLEPHLNLQKLGSNSYAAIIFDLDGLLVDTEILARRAWQQAAAEFGCSITDEEFERTVGRNISDTNQILTEAWLKRDQPAEKLKEIRQRMNEHLSREPIPVKRGAIDILQWSVQQQLLTAVASSTRRDKVLKILTSTGLINLGIQAIVGGDEVSRGKPEPDTFQLAASRLKVSPKHCLVLEDSDSGVIAAHRAEMTVMMVPDRSVRTQEPSSQVLRLAYRSCVSLTEALELLDSSAQ